MKEYAKEILAQPVSIKVTAVAVVLCLGFLGAKAYHNLANFKSTETILRAAVVQQCEKNPRTTPEDLCRVMARTVGVDEHKCNSIPEEVIGNMNCIPLLAEMP
jgi:hypothetical protein